MPDLDRERAFRGDQFYAALDAVREVRRKSWRALAREAGVNASTLTRMRQGRRPDLDSFAALVSWANLEAHSFLGGAQDQSSEEPLAQISVLLRRDSHLTDEAAQALDELIKATYTRLRQP